MTGAAEAAALRRRDAEARATAQREFDRPVVVEAGAGSGKTTLLVARVVVWSLGPGWQAAARRLAQSPSGADDPDRIAAEVLGRVAAITFTDAAAAELARRTGEALVAIASRQIPTGVREDALPAAAERVPRARALVGALEHLVVRTIHAYCRRLLAQFALEAGFHPGFEVDADELVREAVLREVVEAAVEAGYGDPGDPNLIALGVAGVGPGRIERALKNLVDAGATGTDLAESPFQADTVRCLADELAAALDGFRAVEGGRMAAVKQGWIPAAISDVVPRTADHLAAFSGDGAAALDELAEALRSDWHEQMLDRLAKWAAGHFTASERKAIGDAAEALSQRAVPLAESLANLCALRPLHLEGARRALGPLLSRAYEVLRARGAVTYEQLLRGARDLLRDHPAVRRRVRADLDQLLVDEFQDTDPLQCEIIRWIALDESPGHRPGLFLVGDPKQSIYGWRNADLAAYDAFVDEVLGRDGQRERLSVNYRSLPGVLDEVERAIEPVMQREPGLQPDFQKLVASEARAAESPLAPSVEYWVSWEWDASEAQQCLPVATTTARLEARALAADLRARCDAGELHYRDVGILFRSSGDLDVYLHALRSAGVPYAVERDRAYYRRREVIEAAALVRCVLDRNDHVALLAWLRSASVGVPDAALLPLWSRDFPLLVTSVVGVDAALFASIDAVIEDSLAALPHGVPGLDRIGGWDECLREAVVAIAQLRASFDEDPADVFVENLRDLTLVEATEAARFLGAFRVANLERFFRELRGQLEAGGDRETLLRRLRSAVDSERDEAEGRPATAFEDAVRVMTIHKAKGLGFGHTYVVQLHKDSRGRSREVEAEFEPEGGGCAYRLFGAPTPGYRRVERQRERVAAAERVRSLYVAMTRAEDRLVLIGRWKEDPAPVAAAEAKTYAELLASRRTGIPDLAAEMRELARTDSTSFEDDVGARWVFPALEPDAAIVSRIGGRAAVPSVGELRSAAAALRRWRAEAAERERRPWSTAPSSDAHAERIEARAEDSGSEPRSGWASGRTPRAAAIAAGVAVHRILEELDLRADPDAELDRQRQRLPELLAAADAADLDAARQRAQQLLDALRRGELLRRLRRLAEHVVARELPVLLPAGERAVGFTAGSIDLCYRDPENGEWVVADYKTDRVEDDAAVAELVERYAEQGRHYQRALREAMQLDRPPRFELWFLDADRVETVA